jgi:hypothetical protein
MDEIKNSILEKVLIINSDLSEDDDVLNLVIDEVVDRVLTYTNRYQLIRDYEEDVEDYPITDKSDTDETYYLFWKKYTAYPIPTQLVLPIARVVNQTYKTYQDSTDAKEIKSISDGNQSITFGDSLESYMANKDDEEVLMGLRNLLNNFRIPTIVEST